MKLHLPKSILAAILAVLASLAQAETRTYTGNNNKQINTFGYDTIIFQMSGGGTNNYFSSAPNTTCTTEAAIKIQDDTTTTDQVEGLIINNGHVKNVQIFTGALSGDGLLQKTGYGSPNTIVFEGDTSGFTGSIDLSSDSTFTLVFGGNSEAVSAAKNTAEKGIIGSGDIIYNSADKDDSDNSDSPLLQTLRFNYAASDDNKPVYITNSIKDTGKGTSKLELSGGADYTLTKEVTVDELSISAGVATFSQNLSVGSISGGGDIALADGRTLTVGRTTGTIAADITGAVSLIKSDSTSTTLNGNNSFTGGTSVQAGTLIVDSAAALAGAVTVYQDATLQFNANPTAACDITLDGKLRLTWINTDSFVSQLSINDATFCSSANSTESADDGYARWINPVVFNGNIYLGGTGSIDTENLSVVDNKLICSGTFTKSDTFYVRSKEFKILESTDTSAKTFHVTKNAQLDINGKQLAGKNIQLDAGATLTNTGNPVGVGSQQIQDITLNGNARVIAKEGKEFGILGRSWGSTTMHLNEQILTKEGNGTFFLVNTTVSGGGKIQVNAGTLQTGYFHSYSGIVNAYADSTEFSIATGAELLLANNSNLSAAGISGAGSITKTGNISTTLTLAGSGEYTFSGSIVEQIAINKTGSGHQLLTGNNTISSLTMTAGTLTLGSDGAKITLSTGTVTNGGTVNLAGNFTISGALSDYEFASSAGVEYSVAGTSNGFKTTRGDSYYLFKGGSGSVAEGMNPASINLSSASQLSNSATLYATEGGIVFTFGGSNTTNDFYVQEGTVKQSTLLNDESYGVTAATAYIVTSGGTLELSQSSSGIVQLAGGTLVLTNEQSTDMTDGAIQVTDSASSLQLAMGVTLNYGKFSTTEGAAASLKGSGTLLVSNGEVGDSLSSVNLTSGEWTGILHLQGITTPTEKTGGVNLDNIAGNSSLLVLDGVSGFLSCEGNTSGDNPKTLEHETNLKLQGNGLALNDGFSHITHRFTGEISGSGALTMSGVPSHTLDFSGKTSDWTGKISLNSNKAGTESFVTFSGTSEINNESISADRGTLNLTISAPGQVDVKSSLKENGGNIRLTVNAGTNAALTSSDISVDAVDNAGNLSFTGIQSLNLTDLSLADGSVLSVGSGVATIAAESADTFTGVTVSDTAVLEGGSTINGSLDLSEAASIELNNMDEAIDINGDLILVLGEEVTVSGNYTEMLENLIDGQSLDIFRVSGSITLNGLELTDGYSEDAGSLIAAIEQGRYSLGYRASATGDGGTLYLSTASSPAVPEPTTATLSLLALAAMAARRRRK